MLKLRSTISAASIAAGLITAAAVGQTAGGLHPYSGSRMPRPCPVIHAPPNAAQAAVLLQCTMDWAARDSSTVMQDVRVAVGAHHPLDMRQSIIAEGTDVRAPIYDTVVSATQVDCIDASIARGHNCTARYYVNAPGQCYSLIGKGWRCTVMGPPNSSAYRANLPPPTAY